MKTFIYALGPEGERRVKRPLITRTDEQLPLVIATIIRAPDWFVYGAEVEFDYDSIVATVVPSVSPVYLFKRLYSRPGQCSRDKCWLPSIIEANEYYWLSVPLCSHHYMNFKQIRPNKTA